MGGTTHGVQINNGGGETGNSEKANSWYRVEDRPHRAWKKNKKDFSWCKLVRLK